MIMLLFPGVWDLNGVLDHCQDVFLNICFSIQWFVEDFEFIFNEQLTNNKEIMNKYTKARTCERDKWKQQQLGFLLDENVPGGHVPVLRLSSSMPEHNKWDACQESSRMCLSLSQASVLASSQICLQHQQPLERRSVHLPGGQQYTPPPLESTLWSEKSSFRS